MLEIKTAPQKTRDKADDITELSKFYDILLQMASNIPNITEISSRYTIAKLETDMTVFKSAKHLCSWAEITPQNNEEHTAVGKRKTARFQEQILTQTPADPVCACYHQGKAEPIFRDKHDCIKMPCRPKQTIIAVAPHALDLPLPHISEEGAFTAI